MSFDAVGLILAGKVDKYDFEKMNENKANKCDTENMLDLIRTMNQQIQHAVLILNESLKLKHVLQDDSKLANEDRAMHLMR